MKLCGRSAILTLAVIAAAAVLIAPSTVAAQSNVYTLKECIDKALKVDMNAVRARNDVTKAKADVLSAWGLFLPDLGARVTGDYYHLKVTGGYTDVSTGEFIEVSKIGDAHGYGASLASSLTLFDGFSRLHFLGQSRALLRSYQHKASASELNAAYDVKAVYFNLLQAQYNLKIKQKALERTQELMKIAQTKYELGSASLSDVLKAKVSLSQAQLDLLTAENGVRIGQANLNYAIGEPVDQEIVVEDVEAPTIDMSLDEASESAFRNNPSYLSTQEDLRSAELGLKLARSEYFPSLTMDAAKSWQGPELGKIDEWLSKNYTTHIGASLSFNIFNGFQTRRSTQYAKANLHTAEYEAADFERAMELEVREAYLNLQEKSKARELSDEEHASAQEDYKLAQEKYKLGAATILDILDAEVSLRTAESHQIDSRYGYYLAVARLQNVMGTID